MPAVPEVDPRCTADYTEIGSWEGGVDHSQPPPRRCLWRAHALEEVILLVRLNGAVRGRVGDAREREALGHLVLVEERAVRLVHSARGDDARARRAGARAARVGKVDAVLLSLVKHVRVAVAVERLLALGGHEGDGEHLRRGDARGRERGARHRARWQCTPTTLV